VVEFSIYEQSVLLDAGGIAMHPLDVYRARPLKPVLEFKLHRMTDPELVHPVSACLGAFKANFLPVFGQNAAGTVFPRNPRD
jgi:hypothetical protein